MKWLPLAWLLSLCLLVPRSLFGQAYAPETEYHDRVQRHFVVEYARVLAWRQNEAAKAAEIAEVKYHVSISADRVTTWKIQYCDAAGATVREGAVSYPEASLLEGPAWYRNVAAQLGFMPGDAATPEPDLVHSYWTGAEQSLPARSGSLEVLFTLNPAQRPAQAAGLLTHATLPSLATEFSLDAVLLARGAAWLCLAEHTVARPTAQVDALWAPTLFLAGRENDAAALWKKAAAPTPEALGKWWAFLLSSPASTDVFAFAADPQFRRWAMPLLVFQAERYSLSAVFPQVIAVFAEEPAFVYALHDYGIFFARHGGVSTGRILEGGWPYLSRSAWAQLLRDFKPEPLDYAGYQPVLAKWKPKPWPSTDENSIADLTDAGPMLNLGFSEGVGKLTPTPLVTARDLLNFGWELNGCQLSARWHFVEHSWGFREDADRIAHAMLPFLEGITLFFEANDESLQYFPGDARKHFEVRKKADLLRVQELDLPAGRQPGGWRRFDPNAQRSATLWPRRCWLHGDLLYEQCTSLGYAGISAEAAALLPRVLAEGGPLLDRAVLEVLASPPSSLKLNTLPDVDALRDQVIARVPEPSGDTESVHAKADRTMPPLERAQKNEKMFWLRPGSDLPYARVFTDYLRAHAYEDARRFYREAHPFLDDVVAASNSIGPARFILALYEDDREGMVQAMKDNASGSYTDTVVWITAAGAAGDAAGMARLVDECLERYPPPIASLGRDRMSVLKGFIPLLPALEDPNDPKHEKALDYFTDSSWALLQFALARHAKLSPEEAVRFLGGPETDGLRLLFVRYFQKDREGFLKGRAELEASPAQRRDYLASVLLICLENELLVKPPAPAGSDLMPAGVKSPLESFREAYKRLNPTKKGNRT